MLTLIVALSATNVKAFTAVASGNWSNGATWGGIAPGAIVSNQDIIIPVGITVTLDMNVSFGGILNNFTVNGTLSSATATTVTMDQGAFSGAGSVDIHGLNFTSLLATIPFTGTLNLNSLRNMGAALAVTSIVSISDTLDLVSGSLSVNSGANFTPLANSTIKMDAGTLTVLGGVFNSGTAYNVMYLGASKTGGVELNTVTLNNLYLRMALDANTITTSTNLEVNGTLHLTKGVLNFSGRDLGIHGNLIVTNGALLASNNLSTLTVGSNMILTSGLKFAPGSALLDLVIDNGSLGDVELVSNIAIAGSLRLADGGLSVENGDSLRMLAGSNVQVENGSLSLNGGTFDGSLAYDVSYIGLAYGTGVELSGTGLNDVTMSLPVSSQELTLGSDAVIAGTLALMNGRLNLNGNDLTVNGTLDQSSTATLMGNSNSDLALHLVTSLTDTLTFHNSNQSLRKLTLDLPLNTVMMLGSDLSVATELVLESGKLDIGMYDLVMQSASAISGYSDTNYVVTSADGKLQMMVNSAAPYVTFPIGTLASYSPAMVQQTAAGTSGNFMVRAANGFLAQGTSGFNYATSGSLVDRTWFIESAAGMNVNMNMKLGWMPSAGVNGFDAGNAYISHYINGGWDGHFASAASAGANNTLEISRSGITSLSPFGVVDTALALSIPAAAIPTTHVNLYPNPTADVIHVDFLKAGKSYGYEIMDLTGKTLQRGSSIGEGEILDVSNLGTGTYFLKMTEGVSQAATVKKFMKL